MEDLLRFARSSKPQLRPIDLNATVRKTLFLVERQRSAATIEVKAELAEQLPQITGDPDQLEQVFLNICLNAMQAMGARGGSLTVSTRIEGERVEVRFTDTGPGIPPEVQPHIFEPFFTTRRDGTGLGLAICARIVEEHRGRLDYRCPKEGGTIFAVSLRRTEGAAAAA
jgi:signal transduction histidine kinase